MHYSTYLLIGQKSRFYVEISLIKGQNLSKILVFLWFIDDYVVNYCENGGNEVNLTRGRCNLCTTLPIWQIYYL